MIMSCFLHIELYLTPEAPSRQRNSSTYSALLLLFYCPLQQFLEPIRVWYSAAKHLLQALTWYNLLRLALSPNLQTFSPAALLHYQWFSMEHITVFIFNNLCVNVHVQISFRKYMKNPNAIILCIQGEKILHSQFNLLSLVVHYNQTQR